MRFSTFNFVARIATLVSTTGAVSLAGEGPVFTILEENDLVVDSDRHYTQGIKLSYFYEDGFLPLGSRWLYDTLPAPGFTKEVGKLGYSIGQNIYTPADLTIAALQPLDRPYAGWLYFGATLERRGHTPSGLPAVEQFGLQLGVIGPGSLAEDAQVWVHETRDFIIPRGWDHQLGNEPGLRLTYWRAVRLPVLERGDFGIDFSPHAGLSLGNVETSARFGGRLRMGLHLPDNFGTQTIDSLATTSGGLRRNETIKWGAHLFAGIEGRYAAHSAFLDGTLFRDSHRVDRREWQGDAQVGVAVRWKRVEAGYVHTFRLPEFGAQTEHHSFGAVYLKIMCPPN